MIETGTLPDHPHDGYALLRDQAVRLAGSPGDIAQRVMAHHQIYRDSGGNHAFPLVALHGELERASEEQRPENHRDNRHQLEQNVQAGAGSVLERVPDRVTHDRRSMRF